MAGVAAWAFSGPNPPQVCLRIVDAEANDAIAEHCVDPVSIGGSTATYEPVLPPFDLPAGDHSYMLSISATGPGSWTGVPYGNEGGVQLVARW